MRKTNVQQWLVLMAICVGLIWAAQSRADAPMDQYAMMGGTVLDRKTQLTWEQNADTSTFTFDEAKTYCDTLTLGGLKWRVPSMKELQTIVDETLVDPSADPNAFPDTKIDDYWTSSIYELDPTSAWTLHADFGGTGVDPVTTPHYVRCVHGP